MIHVPVEVEKNIKIVVEITNKKRSGKPDLLNC